MDLLLPEETGGKEGERGEGNGVKAAAAAAVGRMMKRLKPAESFTLMHLVFHGPSVVDLSVTHSLPVGGSVRNANSSALYFCLIFW